MYEHIRRIHFVGIGGIGMSGIAEVLLNLGYQVSGSDLARSSMTDRLKRRGARISIGHSASHVDSTQVVVTSSAVSRKNPEVDEALRRGLPVIARAEMLAELMRMKYGIAIAGSHGKTSTTSLIASVLAEGGLDPTMVIGGRLKSLRSNARLGKGKFLVAEADESDGSFLHLAPTIAVITNIDPEHMDHYRDFSSLKKTFQEFAGKVPFYGLAVLCLDHPVVADIAKKFVKRFVTYGLESRYGEPHLTAKGIRTVGLGSTFKVYRAGKLLGKVRLASLPGRHNVLNSLAAIAVAQELGIRFSAVQRALSRFRGISRRFEVHLEKPVMVVDDYGHHPEEIRATLRTAASLKKGRLWVLFQPHRYSRTKLLMKEFTEAFGDADHLLITEIYAAGERPIQGITGRALAGKIAKAVYCDDFEEMLKGVEAGMKKGDMIVTLGAGDIWKVGRELVRRVQER
ncbi:MAG: UDP-N-acetylmuramate--L-alanine ligase [Deltaproteobacteria bacterium]|nr:UDP-N-acetylmuramate--L-alanine ligase [Deltaproteobacteria bacterium]